MSVRRTTGENGLPTLALAHPAGSTAELYLNGAQVTSWRPGGREALFLSRASVFQPGSATRGGVPVIFPQFSSLGPLPKHGFARTALWEWAGDEAAEGEAVRATLRLQDSDATRALWPHPFRAELQVALGARELAITLAVSNPGGAPFSFTAALHTYLRVEDVREAALHGLQGSFFRSAAEGERTDEAAALRVRGQVDRVYLGAPPALHLEDERAGRRLRIAGEGFPDVVVWNPWQEMARRLPDLGDDEYLQMLCVEAAHVGEPVVLAPGESWRATQRLSEA